MITILDVSFSRFRAPKMYYHNYYKLSYQLFFKQFMCWINEDSILISNLLTRISLWFHVVRLLSCHTVETREESNLFLPDLYLLEPEFFPKYQPFL